MSMTIRTVCSALIAVLLTAPLAAAQAVPAAEAWRALAARLEPGTEIKVRLANGQRFQATFIAAEADGVVVQPKTRRPVPAQRVSYDAIASMERRQGGMGAGKAALIGVSTGAAAGFAVLLMLIAAFSD